MGNNIAEYLVELILEFILNLGIATGQVIPSMIIFKGKRLKPALEYGLPSGTVVYMS